MLLRQIKSVLDAIDTNGIDDLILAKSGLQNLLNGYEDSGVDIPDWVIDGINSLNREIVNRNRAALEAQLKKAKASREALATVTEKRKSLDSKIAELEKKLS